MHCPSEDLIDGFVDERLAPEEHQAVVEHLGGCDRCVSLVAKLRRLGQRGQGDSGSIGDPHSGTMLRAGTLVGHYAVMGVLGVGAMGVVYRGHDPRLNRPVALKLLRPGGGEALRERLLREAQAMAQLSHENIVTVHDVGTFKGQVFVAMELVEGVTLLDWLRVSHSWEEVLGKFLAAGRGLAQAHRKGLVHRDFKPANVLVDRDGRVRVTDFGLARLTADAQALAQFGGKDDRDYLRRTLTRHGDLVGTPAYMAPEQWTGAEVDARTDCFSFCAALFQALYGTLPFVDGAGRPLLRWEPTARVHEAQQDGTVPGWLHAVLRQGLATTPADRPASMDQLLRILEMGERSGPLIGRLIKSYRVKRQISQGGMGILYEAVHETICRRAAIKVLAPELTHDKGYVRQFLEEARLASAVEHPALVTIFDHGEEPDGVVYILMEYVEGRTLKEVLDEAQQAGRRLPLLEVLQIAGRVAEGLCAVHRRGVYHLDLKPGNVMLVSDSNLGVRERAKVLDFGIARRADGTITLPQGVQQLRPALTPAYASPEQCREYFPATEPQARGGIDGKSDVYSLGVVLYEMLAGKLPFSGASPQALCWAQVYEQPAPLRQAAPTVPRTLETLVHEMLAKEPAARPAMEQVRERLEKLAGGAEHVRGRPGRLILVMLGVGCLAAATYAVLVTGPSPRPSPALDLRTDSPDMWPLPRDFAQASDLSMVSPDLRAPRSRNPITKRGKSIKGKAQPSVDQTDGAASPEPEGPPPDDQI